MHFLLPFGLWVEQWCWSRWQCQRRASTWVAALKSKVTPLSTIVALLALWVLSYSLVSQDALNILISSALGTSIGEMVNLSTIETCRGWFSWHRTFFVIRCYLFIAFIFYAWPTSSWVLLFLFFNEDLTSMDCINWLTSCICTRICCMTWRSWAWTINRCSSVDDGFSTLLSSLLLELRLPSCAIWIIKINEKIRWGKDEL
jgi:hypothetical protein